MNNNPLPGNSRPAVARAPVAWLALVMSVAGYTATETHAGQVRLWPTASVGGRDVLLGDVAALTGFDSITSERLSRLRLRPGLVDGHQDAVTLEEIRTALDGMRLNMADVMMSGSVSCVITAPSRSIECPALNNHQPTPRVVKARRAGAPSDARTARRAHPTAVQNGRFKTVASTNEPTTAGALTSIGVADVRPRKPATDAAASDTLEAALRARIARDANSLGGSVEIRFGAAHRHALAMRSDGCTLDIHPRGDDRIGMVWYEVDVVKGESIVQTIPILAEVTLLRSVVVARGIVNSGEEISDHDVVLEERPFKRVDDIGLCDLSQAIGMESRRALHAGDMLRARDVRGKPLVRRNQIVLVSSRAGGLTVQQTGRASRDGLLGDLVDITMDGSRERLQGVVTGPGSVSISGSPVVATVPRESRP